MPEPVITDLSNPLEITHTRVFNAPRELVWKVWTTPEHLGQWYGPVGFTMTTHHMSFTTGGQWRFTFHGPDGRDYENLITYLDIREPETIVYKHGGEVELEPVNFQTTVTFEAVGGQTRLTMRATFDSQKARDFVVQNYNAAEGGKQTLGRLGELMDELQKSPPVAGDAQKSEKMTLSRVFRAPRELVYRVWTLQDHLAKWFGPKGVTIPQCSLDLRPGGVFHYCMKPATGDLMWGKWIFREIVPGQRLVFTVSFSNEAGEQVRAPWDPNWPLEMLSVITFTDHAGIGKGTVVTIEWTALSATPLEQKLFNDGLAGMVGGWTGTLDKLETYLAEV